MSKDHRKPDFLIIGAGKSGTTSLDNYLKGHPQIFIPNRKDAGFFASEAHEYDEDWLPESKAYYRKFISNGDEYYSLFAEASKGQLVGETSTIYLYSKNGYQLIKSAVPEVKIIAILRQPAKRLYSRFLHLSREGLKPTENFEDLFKKDSIWWIRPDLINEGFYHRHLSKFYGVFPRENIKILLYEDLKSRPRDLLVEIFNFLEVKEDISIDTEITYNKSGIIKNQFVNKVIGYNNILFRSFKNSFPKQFEKAKKNKHLLKVLGTIRSRNLAQPKAPTELLKRITDEIYTEDIRQLEKLIDKDLSSWKY
jgi:hypothetical protein